MWLPAGAEERDGHASLVVTQSALAAFCGSRLSGSRPIA